MNKKPKAIVVGGGIGGLTAAIALSQADVDVTVYERSREWKEIGAGIVLASNAMKVFSQLGLAGRVAAHGVTLASGSIKTWKGEVLVAAAEETREFINACVHRADLQRVLVEALGENNIKLGHECIGFEHHENGIVARFANGEGVKGDFLVGADGINSVVRASIHGLERPRYAGYVAWRAVTLFETELASSESWGSGKRFGIVPMGSDRVYWFATKNAPEGEVQRTEGLKQELLELFKDWHPPIQAIIKATDPDVILKHDLYDRRPLKNPWGEGPVTLLGDAAHPTTPNLGQGACQAIEDAYVLAQQLRSAPDIAAALRQYEAKRIPRTAYITNLSWRIGKIAQLQNPIACWIRNKLLRTVPFSIQRRQLEKVLNLR